MVKKTRRSVARKSQRKNRRSASTRKQRGAGFLDWIKNPFGNSPVQSENAVIQENLNKYAEKLSENAAIREAVVQNAQERSENAAIRQAAVQNMNSRVKPKRGLNPFAREYVPRKNNSAYTQ